VQSWSEAWEDALYGPAGFFRREVPLDHFRTNVAVPLFAEAVRRLAGLVDEALGFPDPFDLVDLGAGRGELLHALPEVPARWRLTAVEVSGADTVPDDTALRWVPEVPRLTGLLLANEWLDAVPLDVVEDGRLVLVDRSGAEELGAPAHSPWAEQWWPGVGGRPEGGPPLTPPPSRSREGLHGCVKTFTDPCSSSATNTSPPAARLTARLTAPPAAGDGSRHALRVEIGASRDLAWAAAVARVERGLAVAADYGHVLPDRRPTLTGYRDGRQVHPVPDGSCDLTAHVALDAVAAATGSVLVRQREALQHLGISAAVPAATDPSYLEGLVRASQARELLDPDGLGGFGWLLKAVGVEVGWMGV
jgi:SAM-dependent MidA family methyltransferase